MEICSSGHEEVCFEGRKCPVCDVLADKEQIEVELEKVKELREADAEVISELRGEIAELKEVAAL